MVDEVHKWGALAAVELGAGGVKDNIWSRYVAPAFDRFPSSGTHKVYTYPATEEDIARIMQMYEDAARRATMRASTSSTSMARPGFSPFTRCRGISIDALTAMAARSRTVRGFGSRRSRRLKRVAGDDCAVATRISIDDLAGPWGLELHDEGLAFVEYVTRLGLVDMWDVIIGGLGRRHVGRGFRSLALLQVQSPGAVELAR